MSDGAVSCRPRNYPSGAKERVGQGLSRRPRNYLLGAKERVGRDWLRLWGVAGAPSVDRSPKGDAPSSPELTVGATETRWTVTLLRALLTAVAREYKYRLPRRAIPEVIDLCALPWNDPSREARNGKVLGGRQLLIGIEASTA